MQDYQKQAEDFLAKTNTNFSVKFKRFGSMPFDKDQNRNVFEFCFEKNGKTFLGEFGASILKSCAKVPEIDTKPEHEIYFGYKVSNPTNNGQKFFYNSIVLPISSQEIKSTTISERNEELIQKSMKEKAEKFLNSLPQRVSSYEMRKIAEKILPSEPSINGLIKRRLVVALEELTKNLEYSKDKQGEKIVPPTAYDVLACLTKYDPGTFENFCGEFGYDTDSRTAKKTYKAVHKEWQMVCDIWTDSEIEELQEIQ